MKWRNEKVARTTLNMKKRRKGAVYSYFLLVWVKNRTRFAATYLAATLLRIFAKVFSKVRREEAQLHVMLPKSIDLPIVTESSAMVSKNNNRYEDRKCGKSKPFARSATNHGIPSRLVGKYTGNQPISKRSQAATPTGMVTIVAPFKQAVSTLDSNHLPQNLFFLQRINWTTCINCFKLV